MYDRISLLQVRIPPEDGASMGEKVQGRKFALLQRTYDLPNGGTKTLPCYELTKTECLYIATSHFTREEKIRVIREL